MERRQKKTVIRTRFPTIEETAKAVGVSKRRLAELIKIMEDIENAEKISKSKNKSRSKKKPRK